MPFLSINYLYNYDCYSNFIYKISKKPSVKLKKKVCVTKSLWSMGFHHPHSSDCLLLDIWGNCSSKDCRQHQRGRDVGVVATEEPGTPSFLFYSVSSSSSSCLHSSSRTNLKKAVAVTTTSCKSYGNNVENNNKLTSNNSGYKTNHNITDNRRWGNHLCYLSPPSGSRFKTNILLARQHITLGFTGNILKYHFNLIFLIFINVFV